jgi:photosystem II stability/assembly factor-like uncharacterized protein
MLKKFYNKMIMNKKIKFLIAIVFLMLNTSVWAGKEKMNARLNATGFTVGNSIVVSDNKFPNVTLSSSAVIKSSVARITLGLDNTILNLNYLGNANTFIKVGVKITHTDALGNSFSQIKELTINHNSTGLTTDRSNVVIKNAHSVIARILYFKNSSNVVVASPLIPSNIFLETEIETERYYTLNTALFPTLNHFYYPASNELEVYWNSLPGAEEYELEYTYVNNISPTSQAYDYALVTPATINTLPSASLPFTFNNNATKIRTSQNSFKISLNYNRGMIVYRIRTVGRSLSNTDLEVFGNWTLNQPQTQLSLTLPVAFNDFYNITIGHEENKNWQATTTFAEEGKKKDVIGYFDGSNHKRQTVTRTNTENVSLVGETIYDSQGRPAITVLPSPSQNYSSEIKFFENFNQSATQPLVSGIHVPYSRLDFETTNTLTCPVPAGGMYTGISATNANGASVYYSSNNQNKENQNAYIPDAKQYPFTHNVYAPDASGSVRYQSGVGEEHKIGNGHETKNVEGDPDQEDLDKLFGSEAGYSEKYKKNMTIDANGQISVSYINSEGKVVSTALAGNAPQNVNQLTSLNVYPKSSKYMDFNDGNYSSVNIAASGALTFKKKILPDITGTYNFFYDISVPQYTENCIPNFCYDCAYDLEIKLTDECNAVIYTQTATVGQPIDYTCNAPIYFSSTGFTPAFNSILTAGKEYFLTKVLTINSSAMNQYLNHYIDTLNNTCVKKLSYFQNLELANIDFGDCHMTCASCSTKVETFYSQHNNAALGLPTSPTYDPNYIYMTLAQKQQAIDKCLKPCKPATLCQTEFETMLQDVRPMGQYAQYSVTSTAYDASLYELSVLNDANQLRISTLFGYPQSVSAGTPFKPYDISQKSHWRNPEYFNTSTHDFTSPDVTATKMHYFDANGNVSKVRLVKLPSNLFYPDVVVSAFSSNTLVAGTYTDNLGYWTYPENLSNLKDFIFAYSNNEQWAYSLVKNHPEFNYFLDCDRQSNPVFYLPAANPYTSEQFDIDLRLANTLAEADGSAPGSINLGQSKWSLTMNNISTDLLSSDPYFKPGAPGNSLFSTMQTRLDVNYQGTGTSIKQICAQMYSSAQMYYAPPSCTSAATFGAPSILCNSITYPIPTAALNEMWKTYREQYIIEKQKLIMETAHKAASNPGGFKNNYYNGAIGDQNFTPWPSFSNYGFFPFFIPSSASFFSFPFNAFGAFVIQNTPALWPNYTALIPSPGITGGVLFHPPHGIGYFDFGSPSSFYHKGRYANKIRRVPDTQTLSNALAGGSTDPNDMMTNLNNIAEAEIYAATGQCPIYKRLELFISSIAKKGTLFNFNVMTPLVSEPGFTKQIYDAILSCGSLPAANWTPLGFTPVNVGNAITIEFYDLGPTTPVHLTAADIVLTNVSATTITNWNDVKSFKDIQFNGTVGSINNFNIKALYQNGINPYSVLKFTGTTCIQSSCSNLAAALSGQLCSPTQQAYELQSFLSAAVNDYTYSATPINLGDFAGNNSSNFFTTLVRYPFTSAAVTNAPISHSVIITNYGFSSNISLQGMDPALQAITVDFAFTPNSISGPQDLSTAVALSNIQPNQTSNTAYDFTIKAHYPSSVTQTFKVKIYYSGGVCGNLLTSTCRFYNIKNCEPIVSGSCKNNNNYKTNIQLMALMNEMLAYPTGTLFPTSVLNNYTNLLQSQVGPLGTGFQTTVTSLPNITLPGTFDYTVSFNFLNSSNAAIPPQTLCAVTLTTNSTIAPGFLNLNTFTVSNLFALNGPSSQFTLVAFNGVNNFSLTGNAPCLKVENCMPCDLDTVIYKLDFEQYTTQTTTSALNFGTEKFDPLFINPATACNFMGNTCFWVPGPPYQQCSLPQTIVPYGDVAILSAATCQAAPYANNTPGGTKFLNSYVGHYRTNTPLLTQNSYVIPWKNVSSLPTTIGKKYEVSFFLRVSPCETYYQVQLIVNDGVNDIVLSEDTISTSLPGYSQKFLNWNKISAYYVANTNNSTFKIKVIPIHRDPTPSFYFSAGRVSIDDIVIKEIRCEKETGVPITPEPDEDDCVNQLTNVALANAQQQYNLYINNVKKDFKEAYTQKCYKSLERLRADYQSSEGHYTLYYYDQGGNLIKTIPPEGVEPINLAAIEPISGLTYEVKIKNDRDNKTKTVFTNHRMATRYEYNSLNQLIRQKMPDHANTDLYSTSNLNSLPVGLQVVSMDFSDNNKGYLIGNPGTGTQLYVTNNAGNTWTQASALTTANVIDIDYAGTVAYGIVSDGTILKSINYNTPTPTWQSISIPGSNTMQFTDIEFYSSTNGYITGKNGLLLNTTDGGVTWNTISLSTSNDLNRVDFKNDGFGVYGLVVGNSGSVYYITPANLASNLWISFPSLSTNIDVLNTSIVKTGNGATTYLNAIISGIDKNTTPNKGTVINMIDINGPLQTLNNLYTNSNLTFSSKVQALATNAYNISSTNYIDVYFGGVLNTVSPTSILNKLQFTSVSGVFTNVPLTVSGVPYTGVNDLVTNGVGSSSYFVEGVTQNGKYVKVLPTLNTITGSDLNTIGATINLAPANRLNIDPSNNQIGLVSGDLGTIINYNTTSVLVSQSQTALTFPIGLNAVTAAKDGSGIVYAVGNSGSMVRSGNFGASWQIINTGLPPTTNLFAAKYTPASPPQVIIAGNGFAAKVNPSSSIISPIAASNTYKSINTPSGNNNLIFLAGDNGSNAVIDNFLLPGGSINSVYSGAGGPLNKIEFSNTGIAYAVGNTGTILKSVNNGGSFNTLVSGTTNNLNDVTIQDQFTAFTFGNSSTILKTTDGGINWINKSAPAASNINVVYNFGNGNILAAGSGGSNLFNINDQSGDYSTRFFYDALGRLIISQNPKQFNKIIKAYSYTVYDAIGRISQVGEISGNAMVDPAILSGNLNGIVPISSFNSWLTTGTKAEVTTTIYDNTVTSPCTFTQNNLRKRVSATYIDNDANLGNGYIHASYYSYDIHGNVKALLQENPSMVAGQTCKRIDYEYDLISGKVNLVSYQKGQPDAYYHKYDYDADNRITNVFTSKDNVDWQQDAKYFYYLHGPLARTEIGNDKVQAMDYAYTIQGWVKGINSVALDANNDIGKDGLAGTQYNSSIADLNKYISYDAVGYALNYFAYNGGSGFVNDYKAIDAAKNTSTNRFDGDISAHGYFTPLNSLFNGNIMAMATSIYTDQPLMVSASPKPQLATYKYDQLNRIKQANTTQNILTNQWSSASANNNYKNWFTYDANGNIETQKRYNNLNTVIDSMTYKYHLDGSGKKQSNRLYHVNDMASGAAATDDIDDQGVFTPAPVAGSSLGQINTLNNYSYDEIGNLIKDNQEGIANIDWTVYGKIKEITRVGTSVSKNLIFTYDATGNRVSKTTYGNGQPTNLWQTTYYVRDAQGNVMATYDYKPSGPGGTGPQKLNLIETPIYGSTRLGMRNYLDADNLNTVTTPYNTTANTYTMELQGGNVSYEIGNHLGNVLTVVSDRKMPVPALATPTIVNHFVADLLSSNDYYAFGSQMPGRSFNSGNYRYGFNRQEKDNEVLGTGNAYTAQFWEYDPRLGRRWNLDPKPNAIESSYSCFSNDPIWINDPNGDITHIYTTSGVYVGTILDKLKTNEVVVLTEANAKAIMNLKSDGKYSDDIVAKVSRDPKFASARFTEKSVKQLTKLSTSSPQENAGLIYADKKTKEVKVDVAEKKPSDKPIVGGEANPQELGVLEKSTSTKGNILGYFHSHPENSLFGSQPSGADFSGGGYVDALQKGGLGVIVTKGKITLYPLKDFNTGKVPQMGDRPKNPSVFPSENHNAVFDEKVTPQHIKKN